ncbi:MAG: hypothetical protein LBH37_00495 [Oscillospiraceae bacterium]|jgi:hypothetical protein|nr:hypothetical protein [Oscillospiraceae bacterium]
MNKIANFLANDERERLKTMHHKELKRRTADGIKAVLLIDEWFWVYRKIAKTLLFDEDTINRYAN